MKLWTALGHWRRVSKVLDAVEDFRQGHEPVALAALVRVACVALAGFGVELETEQIAALVIVVEMVALPLVRRLVTPVAKQ